MREASTWSNTFFETVLAPANLSIGANAAKSTNGLIALDAALPVIAKKLARQNQTERKKKPVTRQKWRRGSRYSDRLSDTLGDRKNSDIIATEKVTKTASRSDRIARGINSYSGIKATEKTRHNRTDSKSDRKCDKIAKQQRVDLRCVVKKTITDLL